MTLTGLVNNALRRLGDERINAITDSEPRAVLAAELWPNTRDEVLRDFEWSVAIRRRALAELDEENLTPFDYVYRLPVDPYCLRLLNLIDTDGHEIRPEQARYIVEGRKLYTNITPCAIRYIARAENVEEYDPLLVEALALKLASKMAFTLSQSREIEMNMLGQYVAIINQAKGMDARESWEGYKETTSWDQVNTRAVRREGWYE